MPFFFSEKGGSLWENMIFDKWKNVYSAYGYDIKVQYVNYDLIASPDIKRMNAGLWIMEGTNTIYKQEHGFTNLCIYENSFYLHIDNLLYYIVYKKLDNDKILNLIHKVFHKDNHSLLYHQMQHKKQVDKRKVKRIEE